MFVSSRIGLGELAALSRRLGTQLGAGVDVRRVWRREAESATRHDRKAFTHISRAVDGGQTLAEAFAGSDGFFPPMFCELVEVGEQSGRLAEVFRQLASQYEHRLQMRREFRSAITWPIIQLCLALMTIGALIWAMGFIAKMTGGAPLDLLGFGLVGERGLLIYLTILILIGTAGMLFWQGVRRGLFWTRPLQVAILRVPKLGTALETIALAQFSWSLYVTLESGMSLRRAITLALRATQNWRYSSQAEPIWQSIRSGRELYEAMAATGVFPRSLLDAVEVGEHSGRLSETLAVVADQYQQEARGAIKMLTTIAGFLVWAMVAMLIIMMIFRIVGSYTNILNNAANGKF